MIKVSKDLDNIEETTPKTSCWNMRRLGEIITLQRGKDLPIQERKVGPFPIMGSNGLVGYHSKAIAKGPGVFVGRSGSVGKVSWTDKDYWPLNTTLWVKDFHGNDPEFIYFLLNNFNFSKYTTGVSVPTLNRNLIHPACVFIPPLPEQRAIARALRAVQAAREARLRELALERERKAALIEHIFTYGLVFQNDSKEALTNETKIGFIPKDWEIIKLGDFNKVVVGYVGPINEFYTDKFNGIPLLSTTNISINGLKLNELKHVAYEFHNKNKKSQVFPGDMIVARHGISGLSAVIPEDLPEAHALNVVIIRKSPKIDSYFLCSLFNSNIILKRLSGWKSGSVQGVVNTSIIKDILIPIPQLDQQKEIANILRACDACISSLDHEARLHDELFRAMLEELMAGRLQAGALVDASQPASAADGKA